MQKAWRTFVNGKDGEPVLWQRPNAPIILWAAATIVAKFVHASSWHAVVSGIGTIALAIWAILEIGWGASYFRRVLGVLVLAYTILSRILG
jgi:hypothetical protein